MDGRLYGTTAGGGVDGDGTVFSVTPGGTEKVLYSFGKSPDGNYPQAGLLDARGTLYGTTFKGGSSDACYYSTVYFTCGTVFSIKRDGTEKVLHSFSNKDGATPVASLIKVKGTLYGTTSYGGSHFCHRATCGAVFSITTDGREKVLHSFSGRGGDNPVVSLVNVNGILYGTTEYGGRQDKGTVFRVTLSGAEKMLHHFRGGTDGVMPEAALINVKGKLYGTTAGGGTHGGGTVFALKP